MSCASSNECNDAFGLICPKTTGNCNCPLVSTTLFCECQRDLNKEFYWDGTICQPTKLYNETCSNSLTDYMCQTISQGTVCSPSGTTYKCQCPYQQYYDPSTSKCISQLTFGQPCDSAIPDMCLGTLGLQCFQGACR